MRVEVSEYSEFGILPWKMVIQHDFTLEHADYMRYYIDPSL